MKFKEIITESKADMDLIKYFYDGTVDSGYYAPMLVEELKNLTKEEIEELGINVKAEIKIFKDIEKLVNKSKLGTIL